MPQYDDPFWTIIVLAVIVLAGVWAHNHHDKPSGANSASDPRGPEISGPPSAEVKSAPHERKAGNGGDDRNKTERAIRNWTAILAVSGVFAAIFAAFTLNAIRGQLEEMKTESAIRRSELAAIMRVGYDRHPNPGNWSVTSQWSNIGKTNAINFKSWEDFKIFRTKEDYDTLTRENILRIPSDKSKFWANGLTVIPNAPISPNTRHIPEQDAWDIAYEKNVFALLWGYAEYIDIFGEFYTIRYCDFFNFTIVGPELRLNAPHGFAAECTQRTQERRK